MRISPYYTQERKLPEQLWHHFSSLQEFGLVQSEQTS